MNEQFPVKDNKFKSGQHETKVNKFLLGEIVWVWTGGENRNYAVREALICGIGPAGKDEPPGYYVRDKNEYNPQSGGANSIPSYFEGTSLPLEECRIFDKKIDCGNAVLQLLEISRDSYIHSVNERHDSFIEALRESMGRGEK